MDRAAAIAAFLADHPELVDEDAILGAVIMRYPEATWPEIESAIEAMENRAPARERCNGGLYVHLQDCDH